MKHFHSYALVFVGLAFVASCQDPEPHGGHGHAHPHPHPHPHEEDEALELPSFSVTKYENGLELFMEHDALLVGKPTPLIAHFTDTRDTEGFVWITQGKVTVILEFEDGKKEVFVADKLLRNGIFKPFVKASRAGKAQLSLKLEGPQMEGVIHAGQVVVYANGAAAVAAAPAEDESPETVVGYLKESQWKTQYATVLAEPKSLQGGIRANGEIKTVAGQAAELAAPVSGRVVIHGVVPSIGQVVKAGERLLSIVPNSVSRKDPAELRLRKSKAETELRLAKDEVLRAKELLAAGAIPQKRLNRAKGAVEVAKARVTAVIDQQWLYQKSLSGNSAGGGNAFSLRSPIDGVVAFANVTPGAVVDVGTRLVYVVNTEKVWLEAMVYEVDIAKAQHAFGAVFTVAGFEEEFVVNEENGRRVAIGAVVNPISRTVPIVFELANENQTLKPGMYAKVSLLTGKTLQGVAIPNEAVVDENGAPTVFVMEGGETFFKRRVQLGVRSGGYVQVLDGVKAGERVVSRGAYQVKLATAAGGIPEHGHQH